MEYFGVFKGLFGYCVLISFRSYGGILIRGLKLPVRRASNAATPAKVSPQVGRTERSMPIGGQILSLQCPFSGPSAPWKASVLQGVVPLLVQRKTKAF